MIGFFQNPDQYSVEWNQGDLLALLSDTKTREFTDFHWHQIEANEDSEDFKKACEDIAANLLTRSIHIIQSQDGGYHLIAFDAENNSVNQKIENPEILTTLKDIKEAEEEKKQLENNSTIEHACSKIRNKEKFIQQKKEKLAQLISKQIKFKTLKEAYRFASLLDFEQWSYVLEKIILDKRLVYVGSGSHAIALYRYGEKYYVFDSNSFLLPTVQDISIENCLNSFNNINELTQWIFLRMKFDKTKPSPLRLRFFSYEDKTERYPPPVALLKEMEKILGRSITVNCLHKGYAKNYSALHMVCKYCPTIEMITLLVEEGADVNAQDSDGWTPLHYLCRYNPSSEIIRFLVEQGADVNAQDSNGWTPLHSLCHYHPKLDIITFLVKQRAKVNAKNSDGWTPLHYLCRYNPSSEIIRFLVEQGADVNAQDSNGWTPLHLLCCNHPNSEMIRFLVEQGADVNAQDSAGWSPLHLLCHFNVDLASSIEYLIKAGANVNNKNFKGIYPLQLLLIKYIFNIKNNLSNKTILKAIKILVNAGAEVNVLIDNPNQSSETKKISVLDWAIETDQKKLFEILLPKIQDVSILERLLTLAITTKKIALTKLILDFITKDEFGDKIVELLKSTGSILLHFLCRYHPDSIIIKLLLDKGAKVNTEDSDGLTPLHFLCIYYPELDIIKFLVERGAKVNAQDSIGWTPLHLLCCHHPNLDIINFLIEQGADVNAQDSDDLTPLHLLCRFNVNLASLASIEYLIEAGANVNNKSSKGIYPLQILLKKYIFNIKNNLSNETILKAIEILVNAGAEVNVLINNPNQSSETKKISVLDWAIETDQKELFETLLPKVQDISILENLLNLAIAKENSELTKLLILDFIIKDKSGDKILELFEITTKASWRLGSRKKKIKKTFETNPDLICLMKEIVRTDELCIWDDENKNKVCTEFVRPLRKKMKLKEMWKSYETPFFKTHRQRLFNREDTELLELKV